MGVILEAIGRGPVAVDTAIFVYFIEEHPVYGPLVEPLFRAIDAGKLAAVTSAVTLLEVLVVPFRVGDAVLAARYEALLTRSRGLRIVDLSRASLRNAARIRAASRVGTPDALQLAAAAETGCQALMTNDRRLPPLGGLRVLQLNDYVR